MEARSARQTQSGKRVHGRRDRASLQQLFQYTTRERKESQLEPIISAATHRNCGVHSQKTLGAQTTVTKVVSDARTTSQSSARRVARTHMKPARIPNKTPNYMHRQVKFVLSLARSVGLAGRVYAGGRASKPSRASDVLRATYSACTTGNIARLARVKQLSYSQLPNTT